MIAWLRQFGWRQFWDQHRRQSVAAMAISTVLHATALGLCGLLLMDAPARPEITINTAWKDRARTDPDFEPAPLNLKPNEHEAGGASNGTVLFQPAFGQARQGFATNFVAMPSFLDDGEHMSPTLLTAAIGSAGSSGNGTQGQAGSGRGTGTGSGEGAGGGFFGMSAEGRRVVYVVDASRSMNHPHPGPTRTRFGRVKLELVRSIGQMTEEQEFFIIYFNDRAIPMPARIMKAAVPETQNKYLRWAVQMKADGFTDPEQALLLALRLKPDVIYFLTDGAFRYRVVNHIAQANQRRVTINTIGFGDDEGEELLRRIADQSGGSYTFIPAETEPVSTAQ